MGSLEGNGIFLKDKPPETQKGNGWAMIRIGASLQRCQQMTENSDAIFAPFGMPERHALIQILNLFAVLDFRP
jgi:hypothetical protein